MTFRISPSSTNYDFLYKEVIESITPGTQFIRAPSSSTQSFVLPYTSSQATSFILEGNLGDKVVVTLNNKKVLKLKLSQNFTEVYIQLIPGRNFILIKNNLEDYLIQVAATNYATFLRSWSKQFFNYGQVKIDDAERQLNSPLSLRAIEHQINFQELLPPTRMLRILTGKIAIRALINEGGTTRGVNDIATAISNTTPVVVPTAVHLEKYEPAVYTMYDRSHDFGGYEFNIWLPNIVAASWAAFIQLANNLDDDIIKLTSVSDLKVSFEYFGQPETHLFDFEDPNSDIVGIITRLLDCFFAVRVGVELDVLADIAFCAWSPLTERQVDVPLGINVLDSNSTLDLGDTLDSTDPADPYSDGWLGAILSPPLDSGLSLDAILETTLFEDLECTYDPYMTLLGSSLLDISIPILSSVNVNLIIDNANFGWIIGDSQISVDNYLG